MAKRAPGKKEKAEQPKEKQEPKEQLLVDSPSRWQSWWVRTNFTLLMIGGFILVIWLGHFALIGLIFFLQIFGYRELLHVRDVTSKSRSLSERSKFIDYFSLFVLQYFVVGSIFLNQFPETVKSNELLGFLSKYHLFISFSFATALLVYFVGSLEKDQYKKQFKLFGWTICVLVMLFSSNLHIYNIFQGIFWFLLSTALIICNDISAYVWGFSIGRTPLIQLSPKKTWEGFIGAFFSTTVFGFFFPLALLNSHFICPRTSIFNNNYDCAISPAFASTPYTLPSFVSQSLGDEWNVIEVYPVQLYGVLFAVFASTVAPFGGFLASGLKRGYGMKDFGDLIPGHGGIVDRMDCQVMMAAFCFCFYTTFIAAY